MIATISILTCLLAGSLTALVHYRSKYWNYFKLFKDSEQDFIDFKEYEEYHLIELQDKVAKEFIKNKNKLRKDFTKKLKKKVSELENQYKEKYILLSNNLEQEYNNACEEVKNELFEHLGKVDKAIQTHAEEMAMKNILTFSCSCSRDLIPCAIDFTKENTFTCPKCGSKYKIAINANPILVGRAVSDEQFANLLEKRLNENKGKN